MALSRHIVCAMLVIFLACRGDTSLPNLSESCSEESDEISNVRGKFGMDSESNSSSSSSSSSSESGENDSLPCKPTSKKEPNKENKITQSGKKDNYHNQIQGSTGSQINDEVKEVSKVGVAIPVSPTILVLTPGSRNEASTTPTSLITMLVGQVGTPPIKQNNEGPEQSNIGHDASGSATPASLNSIPVSQIVKLPNNQDNNEFEQSTNIGQDVSGPSSTTSLDLTPISRVEKFPNNQDIDGFQQSTNNGQDAFGSATPTSLDSTLSQIENVPNDQDYEVFLETVDVRRDASVSETSKNRAVSGTTGGVSSTAYSLGSTPISQSEVSPFRPDVTSNSQDNVIPSRLDLMPSSWGPISPVSEGIMSVSQQGVHSGASPFLYGSVTPIILYLNPSKIPSILVSGSISNLRSTFGSQDSVAFSNPSLAPGTQSDINPSSSDVKSGTWGGVYSGDKTPISQRGVDPGARPFLYGGVYPIILYLYISANPSLDGRLSLSSPGLISSSNNVKPYSPSPMPSNQGSVSSSSPHFIPSSGGVSGMYPGGGPSVHSNAGAYRYGYKGNQVGQHPYRYYTPYNNSN